MLPYTVIFFCAIHSVLIVHSFFAISPLSLSHKTAIVEEGKNSPLGKEFFREEYKLNKKIGSYGIPYISLIDGICMGGVSLY